MKFTTYFFGAIFAIIITTITLNAQNCNVNVGPSNVTACPYTEIQYAAFGADSYQWYPSDYLSSDTICCPTATPMVATTYMIIGTTGTCIDTGYVHINMDTTFNPIVTTNYQFCPPEAITLNATGGVFVSWYPTTNLSCHNCSHPVFTGTNAANYTVTLYNIVGCSSLYNVAIAVSDSCSTGLINHQTNEQLFKAMYFANEQSIKWTLTSTNSNETKVYLFDVLGNKVSSSDINTLCFSTKQLNKGVYIVAVVFSNGNVVKQKVVVY